MVLLKAQSISRSFLSESGYPSMADYFPRNMMTLCLAEFIFRIPQSKMQARIMIKSKLSVCNASRWLAILNNQAED